MKKLALLAALAAIPTAGSTETAITAWQEDPTRVFATDEVVLDELQWQLRALVVFGRGENDPLFLEQMDLITAGADDLAERDVIVVTDTDPDTLSELRRTLRPRSFMLALIGKDGRVAFRKPAPWDVREISRSIDKMPLRQQEISNRRSTDG